MNRIHLSDSAMFALNVWIERADERERERIAFVADAHADNIASAYAFIADDAFVSPFADDDERTDYARRAYERKRWS